MQLTRILLGLRKVNLRKKIPGKIDIGKHRLWPNVTDARKRVAVEGIVQEQKNLDALSTPFLTQEEETLFKKNVAKDKLTAFREFNQLRKESRMYKHKTIKDHLEHLNVSAKWE